MKTKRSFGPVTLGKDIGKHKFHNPNTYKGKENRKKVLARLGLDTDKPLKASKYFMINGIPYKFDSEGNIVSLKKVN